MEFEIIDFHTHPFIKRENNICQHYLDYDMDMYKAKVMMQNLGVKRICGSVLSRVTPLAENETWWDRICAFNSEALKLKKQLGDFYYPGFNVHPNYVDESIAVIDEMTANGIYLMGEVCPYLLGYESEKYDREDFNKIVDYATQKGVVVSIHDGGNVEDINSFIKRHKKTKIVVAHPGEYYNFIKNVERAKMSENFYLDLSGYGLFRQSMLRYAIDKIGVEKIIFGSDYPTCSFHMYLGGVLLDSEISDNEKRLILSENAKRLLKL